MSRLSEALARHATGAPLRVAEADRWLLSRFAELSATRTYHGAGPNPISYSEIEAYARLSRWPLEPRHVAAIRDLDQAWLKAQATRSGTPAKASPKPSAAISPELFDVVF